MANGKREVSQRIKIHLGNDMKYLSLLALISLLASGCAPSKEARFQLVASDYSYLDCPVSIPMDTLFVGQPEFFELYELLEDGSRKRIPAQLDAGHEKSLFTFVMEGNFKKGESREFLLRADPEKENSKIPSRIYETDDNLRILDGESLILNYRKTPMLPPEDVDPIYQRSAYIHPVVSPGGTVLTNIQPPDHYHHYGIWNPWTKTHIGEREVDYWNLAKGEGTVRAKDILETCDGPVFTAFTAFQEHIDKKAPGGERVTMNESWHIRYLKLNETGSRYMLDLNSTFRNIIEDAILFDAYRYGGGLGFRATEIWNDQNSSVLTSEGFSREEADGTRARWCIVEGANSKGDGRTGILFMSHPENREHPEPMRVWPAASHEGQLFFEFCPIRHLAWEIMPEVGYILRYRLLVFEGELTIEEAEMYWNGLAHPPEIVFE
jgi:hypothetical protein